MARYQHNFPPVRKRRIDYSKLFNAEDHAKLLYNRDMAFRSFVEKRKEMNITLTELCTAYEKGGYQLRFSF